MKDIEQKQKDIFAYERIFAFKLGERVLEKPKLSVWMILIPLIIVYHMYRHQKYVEARSKFAENFLMTRRWALAEAGYVVAEGKKKDARGISAQASMPDDARDFHIALISTLLDHYVDLLRADGDDVESLIRTAYGSRTNYMLYLNQLSQTEKRLNAALEPHLSKEHKDIKQTIHRIEQIAEEMRREEVRRLFSSRASK